LIELKYVNQTPFFRRRLQAITGDFSQEIYFREEKDPDRREFLDHDRGNLQGRNHGKGEQGNEQKPIAKKGNEGNPKIGNRGTGVPPPPVVMAPVEILQLFAPQSIIVMKTGARGF
jgi:hypothetical protein